MTKGGWAAVIGTFLFFGACVAMAVYVNYRVNHGS